MATTSDDDYMFNRGYQDSARLVLQHWLWLHRLRYVLHPSIPVEGENLRIADVGTGNAVWIIELRPHLPASTQLHGFDISADHYPAKEWLPSNVSLDHPDIFGNVPGYLVQQNEIVHIRTFAVVVRSNDPPLLLKNLVRGLKPGGYIQWDEMDLTAFFPGVVKPSTSKVFADELMRRWRSECAKSGITYDWIPKLEGAFRDIGLSNIDAAVFPPVHEQRKAFTDNALMGLEDACIMFSTKDKFSQIGSRDQWRELFEKAVMETKQGVIITANMMVIIGQAPG